MANVLSPPRKTYIDTLTGIRAYLSIWLVLYHYNYASLTTSNVTLLHYGRYATDFFLILSGFVISLVYFKKMQDLTRPQFVDFIVKRLAKLYPLYIVTFLFMAALRLGFFMAGKEVQHPEEFSLLSGILNITMMQEWIPGIHSWNFVSWSLSAEFFAYLFIFPYLVTKGRNWPLLAKVLLVALLYGLYLGTHDLKDAIPHQLIRMSFSFVFGVYLYQCLDFLKRWKDKAGLWTTVVIVSLALPLCIMQWTESAWLLGCVDLLWGSAILGLYFVQGKTRMLFANPLALRIGNFSYSTYLIHGVFAKILFTVSAKFEPLSEVSSYIFLLLALGFTLFISEQVQKRFVDKASVGLMGLWTRRQAEKEQRASAEAAIHWIIKEPYLSSAVLTPDRSSPHNLQAPHT